MDGEARSLLRAAPLLVALLVIVETLGLLGSSSFPALLPDFAALWSLTNTDAGWINGIFFAGYVIAVPVLVGSTDRIDPRRILLISLALGAAATLGFALFAQGFWTALLFRALSGVSTAGIYMPGLKLLTDRVAGLRQPRYVAIYTAGYSLSTALSFALTGILAQVLGWRGAFGFAALGAGLAHALVIFLVAPAALQTTVATRLDFRAVWGNRAARGFILAYTGHSWEIFAFRSWIVAYLTYVGMDQSGAGLAKAGWLSAVIVIAGMATSIWGAELAARSDRRRFIGRIMLVSFAMALTIGLSSVLPLVVVVPLCMLYSMAIMADSGALTGGAVLAALPEQRGATLAVHTILSFSAGFLAPLAVGAALDLAGGAGHYGAWLLAFIVMGAGPGLARLALRQT
jgi:predicted MFS family arabinose efflux permease